jgi:hypothetical protein
MITVHCVTAHCRQPLDPIWVRENTDSCAPICQNCAIAQGFGKDYDAITLRALLEFVQREQAGPTGWAVTNLTDEIKHFARLNGITL